MIGLIAGLSPSVVVSETESAKIDDRQFWVQTLFKILAKPDRSPVGAKDNSPGQRPGLIGKKFQAL